MQKDEIISRINYRTFYSEHLPSLKDKGKAKATALCPFHQDTRPSLSINLESGLYNCFSCGEGGDIFTFYQRIHNTDFPTALREIGRMAGVGACAGKESSKVVATYPYRDEEGELLYEIQKTQTKNFPLRRPDGNGGWIYSIGDTRRVLYRLQELIATRGQGPLFIVEGEKDVDTLMGLGLRATTNPFGAGKWRQEYSKMLKGESVVLINDNDPPGEQHVLEVAGAVCGVADTVKLLKLSYTKVGEDATDWLSNGGTREQLLELAKIAPIHNTSKVEARELPRLLSAQEILDLVGEDLVWLVQDLIPKECVVMVSGRPGIGKTWLALLLAKAISEGLPFLGRSSQEAAVAYIDLENPKAVLKDRLTKIRPMKVQFAPGWAMERLFDLSDKDLDYFAAEGYLIILDSLVRVHSSEENDATQMAKVMGRLRELANKGATVLFLHHRGKGEGSEYRGSSDILAGVDIGYVLDSKDGHLVLRTLKTRVGEDMELPVRLKIDHDCVEMEDFTQELEAQRLAKEKEQLETLVDVIRDLSAEREYPNQTQVTDTGTEALGIGKDALFKLLRTGEGRYWEKVEDPNDKRRRLYKPIENIE